MSLRKLLIQVDVDPLPSAFDRIVALDAGADEVLSYGGVTVDQVKALVHGAIFTRSPKYLHYTALFFGGSDAPRAEALYSEARRHLLPQFGLQVSLMLDPNGANTTSAATIHLVSQKYALPGTKVLVLGTGPVGRRLAMLAAQRGATVRWGAINSAEAEAAKAWIETALPEVRVELAITAALDGLADALSGCQILLSAGPAGQQIVPACLWQPASLLRVVVDLNAVPPAGVEGVVSTDAGSERDGRILFGALGIGQFKMKLHQHAIAQLFNRKDLSIDHLTLLEQAATLP
jgi:threonine dehydrogenase-like Zn-dependent dehydrogenase